jgi:5-hydroxyisourate hydrolase
VQVQLDISETPEQWRELARGVTNEDGRVIGLLPPGRLEAATYRLRFETGAYFDRLGEHIFYERVDIQFRVFDVNQHYHIPLLLSPFGYSTYRGS